MSKEAFGLVAFYIFLLTLIYLESNRNINVHVCENDNVTRYIHIRKPPEKLKFGVCRIEVMKMREYRRIKNSLTIRMR